MNVIKSLIEGGIWQALLAFLLWGGILVIVIQGRDVPTWLISAGSLVLGWFFRSSAQAIANARVK